MKGYGLRLWKKHAFDLGVVCLAGVLGFALFLLFLAVLAVSIPFARGNLPSIDVILFAFPEDEMVVMALSVAVGMVIVTGGYAEVCRARVLMGMTLVSAGLVVAIGGIVGLLIPHVSLLGTLNGGPSPDYGGPVDRSWVDDVMWLVMAIGLVVSALLLKRRQVERRELAFSSQAVIVSGLAFSVTAFSWCLLRLLAASEVLLEIGLGGQKLPYITEWALRLTPNGVTGRVIVTVCVGLFTGIGLAKKSFGTFPRYFTAIAIGIFLLCCVIVVFMLLPYYQAYAVEVGLELVGITPSY